MIIDKSFTNLKSYNKKPIFYNLYIEKVMEGKPFYSDAWMHNGDGGWMD